jgi:hypothetical protein
VVFITSARHKREREDPKESEWRREKGLVGVRTEVKGVRAGIRESEGARLKH